MPRDERVAVRRDKPWPAINVLHATDFHNRANSGIAFAVNELATQTARQISPQGSVSIVRIGGTDIALDQGVRHLTVNPSRGLLRMWRYAPAYGRMCQSALKKDDVSVAHIHGVWMYPQFSAACVAQRLDIPTVLTNHGGLQWALRQPRGLGALKKRLYVALMRDRLLRRITVQHAITRQDRDAVYSFFPHRRIEIIPNFLDLEKVDHDLGAYCTGSSGAGAPYILYLGRLHPTKGVDMLIEAFGRARIPRDWRLIIVGPTVDREYAGRLKRLIRASPRSPRIEIRGPEWHLGAKYRLMRDAWVTVLPSHTEVVSLVNLESSACFTPTITTTMTGLDDWTEGGGVLIEPEIEQLAKALSETTLWSDQERRDRGLASRRLTEQRYSAAAVMPHWLELYKSLH
ncbi:MAG TPA: glycosyltransferase [Planctomycetaceae bacterium]|nr:glycosyltransferase [Planctomycetaceae bacterium]